VKVTAIPKTMDNDIRDTDYCKEQDNIDRLRPHYRSSKASRFFIMTSEMG